MWLPPNVVDLLKAQCRPGEGYSDVILRIAGAEIGGRHSRPFRCSAWRRWSERVKSIRSGNSQ